MCAHTICFEYTVDECTKMKTMAVGRCVLYESSHFCRVVVIATVFGDSTGVLNFCYQHVRVNIFNVAENSGCLNHHFYLEVAYLATIFRTMAMSHFKI